MSDQIEIYPVFGPPLLLTYPTRLSPSSIACIHRTLSEWDGKSPLIFYGGVRIFQLVDNRWTEIGGDIGPSSSDLEFVDKREIDPDLIRAASRPYPPIYLGNRSVDPDKVKFREFT